MGFLGFFSEVCACVCVCVTIMLGTLNLTRNYTHICSFRKDSVLWSKYNLHSKLYSKLYSKFYSNFLVLFSVLVRSKVTINENKSVTDYASRIHIRAASNWPKIWKMTITLQFSDMTSLSIFFEVVLFFVLSLVTNTSVISISSLVLEL